MSEKNNICKICGKKFNYYQTLVRLRREDEYISEKVIYICDECVEAIFRYRRE